MFRLNIDIPLSEDENEAIELSKNFLENLKNLVVNSDKEEYNTLQYRLSKDEDRNTRNYLDKDENGRARTVKTKMFL